MQARLPHPAAAPASRSRAIYVVVSLLLLVPCNWQPRLEGGDLSTHVYNSWLARLIESGRAQGLEPVHQGNNVLFDFILSGMFKVVGSEAAQRISVSLAVLTFVWGAFAFISAVSGRRAWHLMPAVAMLAYGWVFHMGFFSFYLSLGLCFWVLALAWKWTPWRLAIAAPILVLACSAHTLPAVWTAGLLAYLWLAGRVAPRTRAWMIAVSLLAMVLLRALAGRTLIAEWSLQQISIPTGADKSGLLDVRYYAVLVGLLLVWGTLFLELVRHWGTRRVVSSVPFQICVIGAASVFFLPTTLLVPGFHHTLVLIAERMSLGVSICVCALLGAARPRLLERCALIAVALVFFGLLYRDERALNSRQDRMQDTVASLAPGTSWAAFCGADFQSAADLQSAWHAGKQPLRNQNRSSGADQAPAPHSLAAPLPCAADLQSACFAVHSRARLRRNSASVYISPASEVSGECGDGSLRGCAAPGSILP